MMLREAEFSELPIIWDILQQAIEKRKQEGSEQWQSGYPNEQSVKDDMRDGYAYVLVENNVILAYAAVIFGVEPAYNDIQGKWLRDQDYVVVHRIAASNEAKGKGAGTNLLKLVEYLSIEKDVYSIRVDTNFDNIAMLKILDRLNYTYCGEVIYNGSPRRAYEKILAKS